MINSIDDAIDMYIASEFTHEQAKIRVVNDVLEIFNEKIKPRPAATNEGLTFYKKMTPEARRRELSEYITSHFDDYYLSRYVTGAKVELKARMEQAKKAKEAYKELKKETKEREKETSELIARLESKVAKMRDCSEKWRLRHVNVVKRINTLNERHENLKRRAESLKIDSATKPKKAATDWGKKLRDAVAGVTDDAS